MVRQGVSIGVCEVDGKTKVSMNLRTSKTEGKSLGAQLLRFTTVVD